MKLICLSLFALLLLVTARSQAALVLTFDVPAEEVFLTGSDTGSPQTSPAGTFATWSRVVDGLAPSASGDAFDLISSIDSAGVMVSLNLQNGVYRDPNTFITYGAVVLRAEFPFGTPGPTPFTADGTRFSYAAAGPEFKQMVALLASDSGPVPVSDANDGYTEIGLVVVPEPQTAILGLVGSFLLLRRRRVA